MAVAFQIVGRVLPEWAGVSFRDDRRLITWDLGSGGVAKMRIEIDDCAIRLDCEVDALSQEVLGGCHIRAMDLSQAIIDLIGFSQGNAYGVEIDGYTDAEGVRHNFLLHAPIDPPFSTAFTLETIEPILDIALSDPPFFMALNDLMQTFRRSHYSPTSCGRVVDSIRRMVSAAPSEGAAWAEMRAALHVSRDYIQLITDTSRSTRHGDRFPVTGEITTEVARRTWALMDRFMQFRLRGNQPLTDLPLLTPAAQS